MSEEEVVQYLVFREDLKLPKGKLAAQAGHAVQLALRAVERSADERSLRWLAEWEGGSYVKVAVRVPDLASLQELIGRIGEAGVLYAAVVDEGRTLLEPGTMTVLGLQPLPRSVAATLVGKLRLL